jgi:hypothetical protein
LEDLKKEGAAGRGKDKEECGERRKEEANRGTIFEPLSSAVTFLA